MTTVHSEREGKFEGAGHVDLQDLRRLRGVADVRQEAPEELDAIYYDTADLRLLTHGVTLRRRSGGRDAGWHVKLPADEGRTEIHAPLRAGKAGAVPGELLRWIAAYTRGAALVPVAHLRTHRRTHLLLDKRGRRLAEAAQDTVAAQTLDPGRPGPDGTSARAATGPRPTAGGVNGKSNGTAAGKADGTAARSAGAERKPSGAGGRTRITHWSEIEVELEDGPPELLRAAGKRLRASGWRRSGNAHKLDHALADELAAVRSRTRRKGDVRQPKAGSAGAAVMDRIGAQTAELLRSDPAARADEPDALHRMRSAARRLRNLLRSQRRLLDRSRTEPVADELRWLTQQLADARDHEVLALRLSDQAEDIRRQDRELRPLLKGFPQQVREQERDAYRRAWRTVAEVLDSARYFALLDALDALAAEPPLRRKADESAVKHLRRAAERDRRRLVERITAAEGAGAGDEEDAAWHAVRKAARRARHTAESALPHAGKRAGRLRKRTKGLQQLLGERQDAVVARSALPRLAGEARRTGADTFGYGLLHAAQDDTVRAVHERLPRAADRATSRRLYRLS
jgi:CHAD domain-containing protein